jgi:hypothetical protein
MPAELNAMKKCQELVRVSNFSVIQAPPADRSDKTNLPIEQLMASLSYQRDI